MEYKDKLLLVVRSKDPQKDKLDLPGGFLDPGESIEQAAKREIQEELGVVVDNLDYLGSYPNIYEYEGILYNTCDVILVTRVSNLPTDFSEEVKEIKLLKPEEIDLNKIAFESTMRAVSDYIGSKV
jgi:NAD+ diphosphatase